MALSDLRPPSDLPAADARVPALVLRLGLLFCGVGLTLLVYGVDGWTALGGLLAVGAALAPQYLVGWVLIGFLAVGQFAHRVSLDAEPLLLLAGVHLLHCLGLFAAELPWRSWMQPAVLRRPVLRFVAIEIPAQVVAIAALALLAPGGGRPRVHGEAVVVLGVLALAAMAAVLLRTDDSGR